MIPTPPNQALPADQHRLLGVVFAHFHARGEWPNTRSLQRELDRMGEVFDLVEAARELPGDLGYCDPNGNSTVTVRGLAQCADSQEEQEEFAKAMRQCVALYLGDSERPELTSDDLARGESMSTLALKRLILLLQTDSFLVSGSTVEPGGSWKCSVSPSSREFRNADSFHDYIRISHRLREEAAARPLRAPRLEVKLPERHPAEEEARRLGLDRILLESDQRDLLLILGQAAMSVAKDKRRKFVFDPTDSTVGQHPGLSGDLHVYEGDLEALERRGLITMAQRANSSQIDVTPEGLAYCRYLLSRSGDALERLEDQPRRRSSMTNLPLRHPKSFAKWSEAEGLLWTEEWTKSLTTVGHLCREAMQLFAAELLDESQIDETPPNPEKTVMRIRKVLASRGHKHKSFLEALLEYWGVAQDLVQRQEHGALKEGETLGWEDAHRVVFHTAVVMMEIDRAIARSSQAVDDAT